MSTMQAWRLHSYGGPETMHLDTIPIPTPSATQVLVSISHVGMNPFDWKIREGYTKDYMPLPLPYTLGVDFVGTVTALGSNAPSRLQVGDRVMTMSRVLGAFAEYIVVEGDILAKVPDEVQDVVAASLPIPVLSAWQALHAAGEVKKGSKVLIHGASGIVGAFAVQFAKAKGCTVIGTASGKNKEYVLSLGVEQFIDYQKENFEDIVKDVDLVLDFVLIGGDRNTTDRSWSTLKKGGAIVSLADPSILGKIPEGYKGYFPEILPNVETLEQIAKEVAEGKVKSKVARVFERPQLLEAMEINKSGGVTGRLVVDFKKKA